MSIDNAMELVMSAVNAMNSRCSSNRPAAVNSDSDRRVYGLFELLKQL